MNLRLLLIAGIISTSTLAFSQNQYEDSVQLALKNESIDSVKVNMLIGLAEQYVRTDAEKFRRYSVEAYELSNKISFRNGIVNSALNVGYFHRIRAQYDSALIYYDVALENCTETSPRRASIHYNIGNVFKAKGAFVKATESYLLSLREADKNNSTKDAAIAQLGLGNVYLIQNKISEALDYFLKTSEAFKKIEDKRGTYISANNIGTCYFKMENYEEAKAYFLEAKQLAEEYNDKRGLGNILSNLSIIYRKENKLESALQYGIESLEIREKFQNKGETIISYHNLAEIYIFMGKYSKAEGYLDKALVLANEIESTKELKFNWNYRAMLDTARGNYQSGFKSLMNYYSYKTQLEEKEVKSDIEELQTKYDTEKKEAEIQSLSQQASIQALEIKQKNQTIIIGVIAFVFVLAAIYLISKQRESKRRQSQTELEQRFLRSQLNPHFISNALVAVQSFMLKNDTESASFYLTKFSKLMREILENSRREFIPLEEEIDMLKNYLDIHMQRLGSFEYAIELDDTIDPEGETIPPMFVQPFVENAVEHGIGGIQSGGKIEVKFRKEGDFIKIIVNDNGKGLSPSADTDHQSLSTKIIRERMDLFNRTLKKKIQLVIDNLKNEKGEVSGTKVELKVPFSYI